MSMHQEYRSLRTPSACVPVLLALLFSWTCFREVGAGTQSVGSWSGGGPKAKSVFSITVDPSNPSILYAGTMGSGVFKSTNGGVSWDPSTAGLTNTYVRSVVIYPPDHAILYAGTNDGAFKSTDAGITWSPSLATRNSVRALAFSASGSTTLYAGSLGEGVFVSTDQGGTWRPSNAGLSDINVRTIATHPLLAMTALAGTGTNGGVDLTSNGGLSWILTGDPDGRGAVYDLKYDPLSSNRVLAAMFDKGMAKSTDGGTTWVRINSGLLDYNCRALALADTFRYVGTDSSGVFFTTLQAASWTQRNAGLSSLLIRALATAPGSPQTVYAGTDGQGLFVSTDAGLNWSPLNTDLIDTTGRALIVRGDASGTVVDGTGFGDGIWTSADGATTWSRATALKTRDSVLGLAEAADGKDYAAIYASGVYVSTNGGASWSITDTLSLANRFVRSILTNPTNAQDLIAGSGDGTFRSTDGGLTWFASNTGFPRETSVRCLTRKPDDPLVVFAGTDSVGVYKSVDGGTTWTHSSSGIIQNDVHTIVVSPASTATVFAGTETGLFRSTTSGAYWSPYGIGLPANPSIRALVIDSANPATMYAGIWEGGVYRSYDGGAHWTELNTGLPDLKVYSLAIDSARRTIYAGTRLRGVFAYTISVTDVPTPPVQSAPALALTAGPNPTRAGAEVRFHLPSSGGTRLSVFDVRGTAVRALGSSRRDAGDYRLVWDGLDGAGRPVPAGAYWIRMESPAGVRSVQIVVLR